MWVAATMPDPGRSEDRRSLENGRGQTPARRADGPSACPGDSSHERGRVGASDNPWDMQQAAKSIRVRNAGEDLLPRPGSAQRSSALGWTTARVLAKAACGLPASKPCGRRGRGETPCRSARPYGEAEGKRRPASPAPAQSGGRFRTSVAGADFVWREPGKPGARCRTTHGAMTRVCSPDKRSAIRGLKSAPHIASLMRATGRAV